MKQLLFASPQSTPQKKLASGSVGEYTFLVGFEVGGSVLGSIVGESVTVLSVRASEGEGVGEPVRKDFSGASVVLADGDNVKSGNFPEASVRTVSGELILGKFSAVSTA